MHQVHVKYALDWCEAAVEAPLLSVWQVEDAPAREPEPWHHPTAFPPRDDAEAIYLPFTTLTLSNIHPQTTLADLCKRIYGGALHSVLLHPDTAVRALPPLLPASLCRYLTRHAWGRTSPSAPMTPATSTPP